MNTRAVQLSFAGGEISPEVYGRPDTVQYRSGASQLRNWIAKPQGPARTRPGLRHVALAAGAGTSRLLPFVYSTGQSLALEIANVDAQESSSTVTRTAIRFYTQGAPLRWAVPFNIGDPAFGLNATADTLTGLGQHRYADATPVRVLIDSADGTGVQPTGISAGTTYYVSGGSLLTTRSFQLRTTAAPGSAISISGGSGYLRAFRESDFPPTYQSGQNYYVGNLRWYAGSLGIDPGVFWCREDHQGGTSLDLGKWHRQPDDGTLECAFPNAYADADIKKLVWRQNGDVLTVANNTGSYPLAEIQRAGALDWRVVEVDLGVSIAAPSAGLGVTETRGAKVQIPEMGIWSGGQSRLYPGTSPNVTNGDVLYCDSVDISIYGATPPKFQGAGLADQSFLAGAHYIVEKTEQNSFGLKNFDGQRLNITNNNQAGTYNVDIAFYYSSSTVDTTQTYVVTAIDEDGRESLPSSPVNANNTLETNGAKNTINWSAVTGAARYRVYKKENGLFGYIGEAETSTTFDDDNIAPDLGITPPRADASITGTNYPAAVGGHEQRLFLASTTNNPQTVWASKTGSELDFTFTLPVQDNNRLKFTLDANQAHTVRHIIGMRDLLLLTLAGEFRVRASDDGGLAPATVFARQEGYDGASSAQPAAISNHVIYGAARGGHVRKLAYEARRAGIESLSISLRAPHLFDDFEVTDFAATKAPFPCVWARSTSGKLLGLTFVPEEQIEGWHQHDTAGTFESITAVPEGDEDVLYAVVKRADSAGNAVYTVERMQEINVDDVDQAACLDAHTSTYQASVTAPYGAGVRLDISSLSVGSVVTLVGRNSADTANQVAFDPQDVGSEVRLTSAGVTYRVKITTYVSNDTVTGELLTQVPETLRSAVFPSGSWRLVSPRAYAPAYLAGVSCSVVADSQQLADVVPALSTQQPDVAVVTLASPQPNVHLGLPYVCDLQTLPLAVQIEGLGTGREKNIDKAWLRLYKAAGLQVGPDADNLQQVTGAQNESVTGEFRTLVTGKWTADGQLFVRQARPFPATVLSLSTRVSFGD